MTDLIRAPWTAEQVAALNLFQQRGGMHPFTCGGDHTPGSPTLVAYTDGWRCPQPYGEACDYRQDWAHAFMADPSRWPRPLAPAGVTPAADQTELSAAIASCPGYEASPNPCRCPCYGCKHHCSAHNPEDVEAADQTGLRDRIADTATPFFMNFSDEQAAKVNAGELADAVMAVLSDQQAAIRAETLREVVEELTTLRARIHELHQPVAGEGGTRWCSVCTQEEEEQPQPVGWWVPSPCPTVQVVDAVLRRMAAGAQQQDAAAGEEQA